MTHVVTESCISCRYTDCVDVCPVDCFREGPNFLAIDPDECIDCAVCVAECPVNAIYAEEDVPGDQQQFIKINVDLSRNWPSITKTKAALPDADAVERRQEQAGPAGPLIQRGLFACRGRFLRPPAGNFHPWHTSGHRSGHGCSAPHFKNQQDHQRMTISATHDAGSIAPNSSFAGAIEADAVIIGAGPVGLFQVFELGLLEIKAHVIDSLHGRRRPVRRTVSGQADLRHPGRARVHRPGTDRQPAQADRAVRADLPPGPGSDRPCSAAKTAASMSKPRPAPASSPRPSSSRPASVRSRRARSRSTASTSSTTRQLHYRVKDPSQFEGKNLVICGGGDSALDWALNFVGKAESVVLLHRREDFRAAPARWPR